MNQAERENQRLRDEIAALRAALQAQADLVLVAAHELRNPMTPMLLLVQQLHAAAQASPGIPERISTGLQRLDQSVERYVRRATLLLDATRLAAGEWQPYRTQLDLSALLDEVAAEIEPYARRAGSALATEVEPGVAALLDEGAIRQVAENLLSNAVKYGDGKPICLALRREGAEAVIRVCDHGVGIASADQSRIFARLDRGDQTSRQNAGGFGIGLWVAGRLVEALGGSIAVESELGQGARFSVRVPLQAGDDA